MTDWDIGYLWWAQRLTYFAVQSVTYLWVTNCILYQHYDEFFIPLSWSFSSKCPNRDTYRPGYGGGFFLQISQFFASDLKVWPTYESVTGFSINIVMNFPCLSVGYFFYLSAPTEILIDPDKEVCFFFRSIKDWPVAEFEAWPTSESLIGFPINITMTFPYLEVICPAFCESRHCPLTHWGWNEMAAIFQTTFSKVFSWKKIYKFWLQFHWSLFFGIQITIFQHWFR